MAEALKGYRGFLAVQERVPEKLSNLIYYQVWSAAGKQTLPSWRVAGDGLNVS